MVTTSTEDRLRNTVWRLVLLGVFSGVALIIDAVVDPRPDSGMQAFAGAVVALGAIAMGVIGT